MKNKNEPGQVKKGHDNSTRVNGSGSAWFKARPELSQRRSLNSLSTHPPPHKLLRHFQSSYEADFQYAA